MTRSPRYLCPTFRGDDVVNGPRYACSRCDGLTAQGAAALCNADPRHACARSQPELGCVTWQREVGADDEPDRVPDALPVRQFDVQGAIKTLLPRAWA